MPQHTTTSERIDELPWLIYWLKRMRVDVIIDGVLGPPHGNWKGLSYGELALLFVAYVVMDCTHFLSPMQQWAGKHCASLSQVFGKPVCEQDFTDDRLAVLLSHLGDETTRPGEHIELELGRRLLRAYDLPTQIAHIDMTSVSVYHQPKDDEGLVRFGHSKDHRPDLRQFKLVLGTLDPVGLPLVTAPLSGEQADDPHYIPTWERLVEVIGRTDFLAVGDCKLASLANRAHIQRKGGFYLTPLPLTSNTPDELRAWVIKPPAPLQEIRLPGQEESEPPVGLGFWVEVLCDWQTPDTQERVTWRERRLVLQSHAYAKRQQTGLRERLEKAENALSALNTRPATKQTDLETRAQAILKRFSVTDYLCLSFNEQVTCQTCYVGPGRPGPKRATHTTQTRTWTVKTKRQRAAINLFNRLAGWRVFVTNTPEERLSLADAVNCYRQEWQPEHGFHRLKRGLLAITPLFLQDDNRIRGLLVLLGIALRVLTLTEFVARQNLAQNGEALKGLYEGNPNRATDKPTTERLLKAFKDITLYRHETPTETWYEVSQLSPLQQRILKLLDIPGSVYAPPATPLIRSG